MEQAVAQFLGFGGGEFAVQEQVLGPGEQVNTGQGQFEPGLVDREYAGREPAEAGTTFRDLLVVGRLGVGSG